MKEIKGVTDMTKLYPTETDYIINLVQRGRRIPIKILNYGKEQVFLLATDKRTFHLYGELSGLTDVDLNVVKNNFANGTYSLGYCRALDKFGAEIKVGDTIATGHAIGKVKEIVLDITELLKVHGYDEFKCYLKYDHILKPLVLVEYTHILQRNEYTDINELQHLRKGEIEEDYVNAESLIVLDERVRFNVKSHK